MAKRKFKIVSVEYDDYDNDFIGIKQDTYLNEDAPSSNYGFDTHMRVGKITGEQHIILTLKAPEKEAVIGFDELIKVELLLYFGGGSYPYTMYMGVISINDIWDEAEATWDEAQVGVAWSQGGGAVKSRLGSIAEGEEVIDVRYTSAVGQWINFDLTPALSLGEEKTFVIIPIQLLGGTTYMEAQTKNNTPLTLNPKLRITYKNYSPDAFSDKDNALTVEPSQDNPEQPLLKWGGVDNDDFTRFRLYRETSPITDVSALTPIVDITDNSDQEYVDTDTLADGTTYYYMVIAEDSENTGNGATFSKNVSFTKPKVNSTTLTPVGSQNVGVIATLLVTGNAPIKRLYVDWKDGTASWYEFETAELTKSVTHIYLSHSSGALTPDVRIEDTNRPDEKGRGFWSSLTPITDTITIDDIAPLAKLRTNVQKAIPFSWVTLDASLSQPASSDATITKYRFKRYAGDAWQDNLADPIYEFQLSGPPWNGTIVSVSDVGGDIVRMNTSLHPLLSPGDTVIIDGTDHYDGTYTVTGVGANYFEIEHRFYGSDTGTWNNLMPQTAEVEVTTSTGQTATATLTYGLGHEIPLDLNFSPDANISEIPRTLGINKDIRTPIGSDGSDVEYVISRPAERVEIVADVVSPHIEWDADKIRQARNENRLVRISFKNEYETKIVEYTGTIEGNVSISTIQENRARLSFTILVYTRTETYIPSKGGVITSIANDSGNCRIYTDFEELTIGDEVRLLNMGNKDYEGVYLVIGIGSNYFTLNCKYTANDTGEWRKAVYTMGEQ